VQKGETLRLREEDKGKADVVVYGVRPSSEWRMFRAGQVTARPAAKAAAEEPIPSWGFTY
jgi:hypothetical protein